MTEQDKFHKSAEESFDNTVDKVEGVIISANDIKTKSTDEQKQDIKSAEYIAP